MAAVEPLMVRDGAKLEVRPIEPDDTTLLEQLLEHLSPRSRYFRFLSSQNRLSAKQLEALTQLDHHRQDALIALEPGRGDPVAVARYAAMIDEPARAEIAVTVRDDWQGRGVGSALAERLVARAHSSGIRRMTGLILAENVPMLRLMASLGPVVSRVERWGAVEVTVVLADGDA